MKKVQQPAGDGVSSWPSFRTFLAAAVLLLAASGARAAVAVPAVSPEEGAQEATSESESDSGPKADNKTDNTAADGAAESAAKDSKSADPEKPSSADGGSSASAPLTSVETADERRERLERELDATLREFDGLILKEQELLEEKREAEAEAAAGGGGAGGFDAAGEGESGAGTGTGAGAGAEKSPNGGATAETSAGGTGGSPDIPAGEPAEGASSDAGGDPGQISNGRVPPDVGDGHDDDIVARQLREAAIAEQDPALREKLWDEYRAYKFGTKSGTGNDGDGSNKDKKKDSPT